MGLLMNVVTACWSTSRRFVRAFRGDFWRNSIVSGLEPRRKALAFLPSYVDQRDLRPTSLFIQVWVMESCTHLEVRVAPPRIVGHQIRIQRLVNQQRLYQPLRVVSIPSLAHAVHGIVTPSFAGVPSKATITLRRILDRDPISFVERLNELYDLFRSFRHVLFPPCRLVVCQTRITAIVTVDSVERLAKEC